MAALIRLMKTLDDQVARCSRCGACQSVCPVYGITRNESDVARGKLMLLDGLMRAFFHRPKGVSERLNRCLLCGACAKSCPRGVNIIEIFLTARAVMAGYKQLSPLKRFFLRKVLANPALFDRLAERGARWQGRLFSGGNAPAAGGSCATLVSPLLPDRHIVPLAPVPFHKQPPPVARPDAGIRVALFVGCIIDKLYPQVATAMIKALQHHGVDVAVPAAQGCCGIPALAGGDPIAFNRMVEGRLAVFDPSGFDYLITGCATCTAVIKNLWPVFFKPEPGPSALDRQGAVRAIAEKTQDVQAFLVNVLGVSPTARPPAGDNAPVLTYHDPCHLRNTLGVFAEPRKLLSANPAYRFAEMPDASSCCGMGGSFNLFHYGLSGAIGEKKAADIERVGASVVATGCPACMTQLSDMLARRGSQVRVVHAIEIYTETLAGP